MNNALIKRNHDTETCFLMGDMFLSLHKAMHPFLFSPF